MGSDLLTKVSINFASFFLVNCRNFFDRFTYDEVCLSVKCRSFLRFFVRNCLTEVLHSKNLPKKDPILFFRYWKLWSFETSINFALYI